MQNGASTGGTALILNGVGGTFASQGYIANLETFLDVTTGGSGVLMESSGWRPGTLVNSLEAHNKDRSNPKCQWCQG